MLSTWNLLRPTRGASLALTLLLAAAASLLGGCGSQTESLAITDQPADFTGFVGASSYLAVGAKGPAPLSFQWRRNGVAIEGATRSTYATPALTLANSGDVYSVVVTGGKKSVTSKDAKVTVVDVPTITTQPVAQTVALGATATFTVAATGGGTISYQWLRNDLIISGATSATYTTAATVAADDGAVYTVAVVNGAGAVFSNPVTLTVTSTPSILYQPASQVTTDGRGATFSVVAVGGGLSYQWRRGTTPIDGATGAIYTTPAMTLADSGAAYSVVVTNPRGTVTSSEVTLTVVSPAASAPPALPAQVGAGRTLAPAEGFVVVRKSNGTLWSWGNNNDGQRGNGTTSVPNEVPGQVTLPAGRTAVQVSVGALHVLALLDNGDVYGWGRNSSGQLGLGDAISRLTPTKITLPLPAVYVSAGGAHSLAILNDGTVYAWGLNDLGQLGNGGRVSALTPTQVPGIANAVSAASGNDHNLVLLSDGRVLAFGANGSGQLGTGDIRLRRSPVEIATGVVLVRAGADISSAVTAGRLLLAWGENSSGQLGFGTVVTTDVVSPYGIATNAVDASSADAQLLVAYSDGSVRGAGANASGEIGDGTKTARNVLTAATGVVNAITVAAGGKAYSLALLADGSMYAWGDNTAEQLANTTLPAAGTATPTLVPGFDAIP